MALLYAEDRRAAVPEMLDALKDGGILLLDRYVYSNIAYQCAKVADEAGREELRRWIRDTEYGDFGLPVPDLNIFLDVPIGFVEETGDIWRAAATSMRRTSSSRRGCGTFIFANAGRIPDS